VSVSDEPPLDPTTIESTLAHFTGTESYYQHWTGRLVYTDGVRFLANAARAHWLIDVIASWQARAHKDPALRDFQLWEVTVIERRATVVCSRDAGDEGFRQEIPFTDFPLPSIKLYVEWGVLLLPSER
jgi:hypothetical protein